MNDGIKEWLYIIGCTILVILSYVAGRAKCNELWEKSAKEENLVYYDVDRASGETTLRWSISNNPVHKKDKK